MADKKSAAKAETKPAKKPQAKTVKKPNKVVKYFKDLKSEFKKVVWPSKKTVVDIQRSGYLGNRLSIRSRTQGSS